MDNSDNGEIIYCRLRCKTQKKRVLGVCGRLSVEIAFGPMAGCLYLMVKLYWFRILGNTVGPI